MVSLTSSVILIKITIDLLYKNGSDINSTDAHGVTPLHLAAYRGQDDNVENLLRHKADPNAEDDLGSIKTLT